jgi:hypothetical protein
MNPNDLFWLARYAHNTVATLAEALNAKLQIILDIGGRYEGVQVWLLPKGGVGDVIAWKTGIETKEQVDQFVATLQPLEVGIAA